MSKCIATAVAGLKKGYDKVMLCYQDWIPKHVSWGKKIRTEDRYL